MQHALLAMLECYQKNMITLEKIVDKMCHNPAILFDVSKRGYLREGYYADMVMVDLNAPTEVSKENILYKCGWSPFEGTTFGSKVTHTFVNGKLVYEMGNVAAECYGKRLEFDR